MSNHTIVFLAALWFVILLVGVTFTIANYRHARCVLRAARAAGVDAEAMLLAESHMRIEHSRLLIFGFFLTMGVAVILRQIRVIDREPFSWLFYGALILGAAVFSWKPVSDWWQRKRLRQLDAAQRKATDES